MKIEEKISGINTSPGALSYHIKTMYFTEDIRSDYAPIEATVVEFKPAAAEK